MASSPWRSWWGLRLLRRHQQDAKHHWVSDAKLCTWMNSNIPMNRVLVLELNLVLNPVMVPILVWFLLTTIDGSNWPNWVTARHGLDHHMRYHVHDVLEGLLSYFVEHLKQCVDNTCKRNFVHLFLCFIINFGGDLCIISWTSHY